MSSKECHFPPVVPSENWGKILYLFTGLGFDLSILNQKDVVQGVGVCYCHQHKDLVRNFGNGSSRLSCLLRGKSFVVADSSCPDSSPLNSEKYYFRYSASLGR